MDAGSGFPYRTGTSARGGCATLAGGPVPHRGLYRMTRFSPTSMIEKPWGVRGVGRPRRSTSRLTAAAGPSPESSGVLQPSHPQQPAPPGHPGVHPRACRPTSPSRPARPTRRPATHLRRRDLQAAQRRGALYQQAQATPGRRHPLRQARVHVPGSRGRSIHQDLAPRPGFLIQIGRALIRGHAPVPVVVGEPPQVQ